MKLLSFSYHGQNRVGVLRDNEVVDLGTFPELPQTMLALLEAGPAALERVGTAADRATTRLALSEVKLEAPLRQPPEFLAIGRNYADHIAEMGHAKPEFPRFFNKQVSCIVGPFDPIEIPRASAAVDYEGELAFVIGRRCRHVPRQRAREVIAGYMIVNDVSVRDWQGKAPTITLGKSWDSHGPTGPWIVTADEVRDPQALELRTWVNGELRQHSNTRHMIYDCFAQIELLSTVFTLLPGMIVSTGTPSGVAHGMNPPRYLRAGDRVKIEIEGVGAIDNPVIDEPADSARL
ncbi:MAG TPA: fumarylacetoacetate hydrolase family protein [Candidatus Binataceae bacterium]|nr:fumarylacetoacetate hydrolase family protein [Candidatus Binataceae bacterium]